MNRVLALSTALLLGTATLATAQSEIGLYVNQSTVSADFSHTTETAVGSVAGSIEGHLHEDEYKMGALGLMVKSDEFLPGARYSVGFRGFIANVEEGGSNRDADAAGLAFVLAASQELSGALNPTNIPVVLDLELAGTPEPLAGLDADQFWEIRTGIEFHLLETAAIRIEGRRVDFKMEESGTEWDKEDYDVTIGYKIRF